MPQGKLAGPTKPVCPCCRKPVPPLFHHHANPPLFSLFHLFFFFTSSARNLGGQQYRRSRISCCQRPAESSYLQSVIQRSLCRTALLPRLNRDLALFTLLTSANRHQIGDCKKQEMHSFQASHQVQSPEKYHESVASRWRCELFQEDSQKLLVLQPKAKRRT